MGQSVVRGALADEWNKQGASDNHYLAAADPLRAQAPIQYHEQKNGKLKQWDFVAYSAAAPAPALLEPPRKCNAKCQSLVCLM